MDKELAVVLKLVDEASQRALDVAKQGNLDTVDKGSGLGPVTRADKEVHQIIVSGLKQEFSKDLVISEEDKGRTLPQPLPDRVWYVDPIDGTKEFIKGNGEWSIMVGLCRKGRPILGVVAQPQVQRLYYAVKGQGAYLRVGDKDFTKIEVNRTSQFEEATIVRSRSHPSEKEEKMIQSIGLGHSYQHGSVGLKMAQISEGRADLYFNFSGKCHLWDICAGEALLQEAGGHCVVLGDSELAYSPQRLRVDRPFWGVSNTLMKPLDELITQWSGERKSE